MSTVYFRRGEAKFLREFAKAPSKRLALSRKTVPQHISSSSMTLRRPRVATRYSTPGGRPPPRWYKFLGRFAACARNAKSPSPPAQIHEPQHKQPRQQIHEPIHFPKLPAQQLDQYIRRESARQSVGD